MSLCCLSQTNREVDSFIVSGLYVNLRASCRRLVLNFESDCGREECQRIFLEVMAFDKNTRKQSIYRAEASLTGCPVRAPSSPAFAALCLCHPAFEFPFPCPVPRAPCPFALRGPHNLLLLHPVTSPFFFYRINILTAPRPCLSLFLHRTNTRARAHLSLSTRGEIRHTQIY